jgi:riboflavin transporter FmnP
LSQSDNLQKPTARSDTRRLTGIALFAALSVALSLSPLKFPAPYAPFLFYELWEIPVVAIVLLYGYYAGLSVAFLNTVVLLLVFPGASPSGPIYNFIALVATITAMVALLKVPNFFRLGSWTKVLGVTSLAIIVRVVVMTVVNYYFLQLTPPLGFSMPPSAVILVLPLIAFFNATVVLYSVPIGCAVVKSISGRFRIRLAHSI